jgi:hypothetical protein
MSASFSIQESGPSLQMQTRKVQAPEKSARQGIVRIQNILMASCSKCRQPQPIFIVAAPRTGSTVFYQALTNCLGLPYFSNLANDIFGEVPLVAIALQRGIPQPRSFKSYYGKTRNVFEPSEASNIMRNWFGGGHPSQSRAAKVLPGKKRHMFMTLACAQQLYGNLPVVIKNAWNCFRIQSIAKVLPGARFIWLTRDIARSALSDLEARYETKGDPSAWNSATPAKIEELQKLPPEYQVVENQFEFNKAIKKGLSSLPRSRWRRVSYEEFIENPHDVIVFLCKWLRMSIKDERRISTTKRRGYKFVTGQQRKEVQAYIRAHRHRLTY